GEVLAMALGEGVTAEAAEEQARQRLQQLLAQPPAAATPALSAAAAPGPPRVEPEVRQPAASGSSAAESPGDGSAGRPPAATGAVPAVLDVPAADPVDWSAELARIDLALRRIGWQRDQEGLYLERVFGHPSRSRLTTYNDLLAYLRLVEQLAPGADPMAVPVPLRRADLLEQSDALLGQLGWDVLRGRRFLEQHLGRGSRLQLNDAELLQFNMLLEEALLAAGPAAQPAAVN
ncbi:MAG: hypothetical protein ACKOPS_14105, partial [Cyanobium sp.]